PWRRGSAGAWATAGDASGLGLRAPRFVAGRALERRLQLLLVPRQLLPRLPADDERHEQPADPVPLELEGDRDARPLAAIERLDRARGRPGHRAVRRAVGPGPRRIQFGDLLGPRQLART